MTNPYYDDERIIRGGPAYFDHDRRPDHGVCVFSHSVGSISPHMGRHRLDDLRRVFASQYIQMLRQSMNIVIVQGHHEYSIELWLPEGIQVPKIQMLESEFRTRLVPSSKDKVKTGTKLRVPPLPFYDRLKAEIKDWVKLTN